MTEFVKFDSKNRKVWNGTAFVVPQETQSTLRSAVQALSVSDRNQLLAAACKRSPYGLTEDATIVYNMGQGRLAQVILFIQRMQSSVVSVQNTKSAYSVRHETQKWGSCTTYTDADRTTNYMWGARTKEGKPNEAATTAALLGCAFKTKETGTKVRDIQTPSRNKSLYPTGLSVMAATYAPIVEKCTTPIAVQQRLEPFCGKDSDMKLQIASDLKATCPGYVSKFGPRRVGKAIICVKGTPTSIKPPPKKDAKDDRKVLSFENKVEIANQMASSLGSSKDGIGLIRSYHYDGICDMVGAARERHEWLTDFIYQKATCYLVRTRNPTFALALYRCILQSNKNPFIVVYEATGSAQTLAEYITRNGDDIAVTKTGIVGIPSINWNLVVAGLDTYYINFKPPTRAHGTGGALITNAIRERQAEHTIAKGFGKFMYYGFLASMTNDSKVRSSTRGRDTRVIFTNTGNLDRSQAAHVVLNMARHATVYPYIHSCYMYTVDGNPFYPGVRKYKSQYDFSTQKKVEYSLGDLGSDVRGIDLDLGDDVKKDTDDEDEEQVEIEDAEW